MAKAILRFYEELNFHLPEQVRKKDFELEFEDGLTIKSIIESLGVPSEEVDLILAKGHSVDFGYTPGTDERISIFPVFESMNITQVTCLPHRPLRSMKFVLDPGLENLAIHMREIGQDVRFDSFSSWSEVLHVSKKERRILLTSHPELLRSEDVTHGILLPAAAPDIQLQVVMKRLDIDPVEPCSSS